MTIYINDNDVCPKCGAYWCSNGYCCNGHPRPQKQFTCPKCGKGSGYVSANVTEQWCKDCGRKMKVGDRLRMMRWKEKLMTGESNRAYSRMVCANREYARIFGRLARFRELIKQTEKKEEVRR